MREIFATFSLPIPYFSTYHYKSKGSWKALFLISSTKYIFIVFPILSIQPNFLGRNSL